MVSIGVGARDTNGNLTEGSVGITVSDTGHEISVAPMGLVEEQTVTFNIFDNATRSADGIRSQKIRLSDGTEINIPKTGNVIIPGQFGTLTINAAGDASYTANAFSGPDAVFSDVFEHIITDGDGDVRITPIELNPRAIGDIEARVGQVTSDGQQIIQNLLDGQPDGTIITAITINGQVYQVPQNGINQVIPNVGTIELSDDGSLTITRASDDAINFDIEYTMTHPYDPRNLDANPDNDNTQTGTLSVAFDEITPDNPVIANDNFISSDFNEVVTTNILTTVLVPDGLDFIAFNGKTLSNGQSELVYDPLGVFTVNGNGIVTFAQTADERGTAELDISIFDTDGDFAIWKLTVTTNPVDQNPNPGTGSGGGTDSGGGNSPPADPDPPLPPPPPEMPPPLPPIPLAPFTPFVVNIPAPLVPTEGISIQTAQQGIPGTAEILTFTTQQDSSQQDPSFVQNGMVNYKDLFARIAAGTVQDGDNGPLLQDSNGTAIDSFGVDATEPDSTPLIGVSGPTDDGWHPY